ncbi:HipA domain-containing protein [Rhizomicrobium electricum]|uniref:HipA-like C-terminal domain-containing protein n=1 Tax=Rhizomicrobium electricum TaxID=480070 RepID=A0ABP3Q3K5_9PROT|nr:HipA domain-containing protein [Rhizomicrobium electricum]NIJ49770.1 hypothetical protein [Rhizomicrobium electricum]
MAESVEQQPHQIVDISSWETADDFGAFPIGSKPKRSVICPDDTNLPFLIPGHTYLFKSAVDWRKYQLWSEVIAYRLSKLCGVAVPPCFVAVDGVDRAPGVLMEFCYGYPEEGIKKRMIHGVDLLQQVFPNEYNSVTGRPHTLMRNIVLCRALHVAHATTWWASTIAFDALIGNTDRHAENWAVLRGADNRWEMAPAYDNGTSLGYMTPDAKLPITPEKLAHHIARGTHHVTWNPTATGHGDGFDYLCQRLCTAIPAAERTIGRLLPTNDAPIGEMLSPLTQFDISVPFSVERAKYVEDLIRARRHAIAKALGV